MGAFKRSQSRYLIAGLALLAIAVVDLPAKGDDVEKQTFTETVARMRLDFIGNFPSIIRRGNTIRAQNKFEENLYDEIMEAGPCALRDNWVANYNKVRDDIYALAETQEIALRALDDQSKELMKYLNTHRRYETLQPWKDSRDSVRNAVKISSQQRGPSRPIALPEQLPDEAQLPCRIVDHGYGKELGPGQSNTVWMTVESNRRFSIANCKITLTGKGPVEVKTGPQKVQLRPTDSKKVIFDIKTLNKSGELEFTPDIEKDSSP